MNVTRLALAVTVVVCGSLALTGCSVPQSEVVKGSAVAVAWDQPFSSYNGNSVAGDTAANSNVIQATNSGFNFFDEQSTLKRDTSFGTYEVISEDPLRVKYTIADGVAWSDGTAVDAADLLLNWVSLSGAENTSGFDPTPFVDSTTREPRADFPADVVFFDSGAHPASGAGLVSAVPEISDDKKSITMTWDAPFVDWERAFSSAGLPAHVVAGKALGIEDAQRAKNALVRAIVDDDTTSLAKIARFWNTGFNFTGMPSDPSLVVGNGPYTISDFVANESVTLRANANYVGEHKPTFATVTVRFIGDPLAAIQALEMGEVQVIAPPATADAAMTLKALDAAVVEGAQPRYEHLDLQFDRSKNGTFTNPLLREAFLKVIPRQQIVEQLVAPIQPNVGTRDSQIFLPGAPGYSDSISTNGSANYTAVDVEGAKALIAQAGRSNPEVCILFSSTNELRRAEFQLIQQSAGRAGFTVTDCSSPDPAGVLGTPGAYDASLFAWQATGPGPTSAAVSRFTSSGAMNLNYYSNPKVDELADRWSKDLDVDDQILTAQRVDALLWKDFYGATIFQYPALVAYDPSKVANISQSTLSPAFFWNIWAWKPAMR